MTNRFSKLTTALTAYALVLSNEGWAAAQEAVTKEVIAKVWRETQQRVRSVSFKWTEKETHTRGSLSRDLMLIRARIEAAGRKVPQDIPPQDTTVTNLCSIAFDGEKVRRTAEKFKWSDKTQAFEPVSYVSVFDGTTCKVLNGSGPQHENYWPQGVVRPDSRFVDAALDRLQPILMTFRGMTSAMRAYDLETFELTGQRAVIDGRSCLELQQRVPTAKFEERLWVDPSRGFVIVRYLAQVAGKVTKQIDVQFQLGPEKEWTPRNWLVISNDAMGRLRRACRASVTECKINPKIPSSEFALDFPPGAVVADEKGKEQYLVRLDGSGKRPIVGGDKGANYESLLTTAPGHADQNAPPPPRRFWVAAIALILASGALIALFFRYKGLKQRSCP